MKRIKLVVLLISIAIILLLGFHDNGLRKEHNNDEYASVDGQIINIYEKDGKKYLFLPSFAREDAISYSKQYLKDELVILKSANIPAIFISTQSGNLDGIYADKAYKETGSVNVRLADGSTDFNDSIKYIKGHGNYSFNSENWDKKSFTICLKKTGSILGLPAGERFTLFANASDSTLIRNDIARELEIKLGVKYASKGRFVDLYINNEYLGNYYLCPNIEIGSERININNLEADMKALYKNNDFSQFSIKEVFDEKYGEGIIPVERYSELPINPSDISGGYLIEREFFDRYKIEYEASNSSFIGEKGEVFLIKSPDYCSREELEYIEEYIENADYILRNNVDEAGTAIDIESFALRYLAEEITKNYDAGISSAYFYKDAGTDSKLCYAPGWDYDMSLGNYLDWMEYVDMDPTGITYGISCADANDWFLLLHENETFSNLVRQKYLQLARPYLDSLVNTGIDEYYNNLNDSLTMDAIRWSSMYNKCGYISGDYSNYVFLKDFIESRMEYLDSQWSTND